MDSEQKTKQMQEAKDFVRSKFDYVDWPTPVLEPITAGRFNKKPIEGHYALCDANNGEFFQFVSEKYSLITNEEIVQLVHDAIEPLKTKFGEPQYKFLFPGNDSKSKFILKVDWPSLKKDVRIGDPVSPRITIKNSYDKTWKHSYDFGILELVCANGLAIPKSKEYKAKRHMGDVFNLNIAEDFNFFLEKFDDTLNLISQWDKVALDTEKYDNLWVQLPFSEKEKETIEELPIIGYNYTLEQRKKEKVTLWDVSKATTQFISHEMKSQIRAEDISSKVSTIINKNIQ